MSHDAPTDTEAQSCLKPKIEFMGAGIKKWDGVREIQMCLNEDKALIPRELKPFPSTIFRLLEFLLYYFE